MNIVNKKIWLIGSTGMLGSSLFKLLEKKKTNIITSKKEKINALVFSSVDKFIKKNNPEIIINCAAKVGGIKANSRYPAEFIYENTLMNLNIIHAAYKNNISNLINFGSSCTYPLVTSNKIKESMLGDGFPEITNQWYSFAKLNSLKMSEAYNLQYRTKYISIIPTNLYGPGDNFDKNHGHVIPALIRKFHSAKINNKKSVNIWGSGNPLREFMYVDDAADGILFIMKKFKNENLINLGTNKEIKIKDLALKIAKITKYKGKVIFDKSKPDGAKRKILNSSKLFHKGWRPQYNLDLGLTKTYEWYLNTF